MAHLACIAALTATWRAGAGAHLSSVLVFLTYTLPLRAVLGHAHTVLFRCPQDSVKVESGSLTNLKNMIQSGLLLTGFLPCTGQWYGRS